MATKEELEYYKNHKCCGTCHWHCQNPKPIKYNAWNSKTTPPWVCGCVNNKNSLGKGKRFDSGRRCTTYEPKTNGKAWCFESSMLRKIKKGYKNLSTIANDIYKKHIMRGKMSKEDSITSLAELYNVTKNDILMCIAYVERRDDDE